MEFTAFGKNVQHDLIGQNGGISVSYIATVHHFK